MFAAVRRHFAAVRRQFPVAAMAAVSRTRIGLQFRGNQLALARLALHDAGPVVEQLNWLLAEPARRGEAVRRLAHTGALRDARVHLVLAPGEYDLYQLPAPNVPDDEMRDALRWQLRGTLPYAPEVAEIDFVRVPAPPATADATAKPAVLVVAAARATVDELVAPFAAAGVEVHAVDVPEFAQRNLALLHARGDETAADGCVAWLSFDHDACVLTVHTGAAHEASGDLCFTRRIHIPGANGMTPNTVLETEHTVGYLIERIVTQVQRSLDVFERQSGQPAVVALTVGPHRHGVAIAHELSDRLALACRTFDPGAILKLAAGVPAADAPLWADGLAALGAALRIDAEAGNENAGLAGAIAQRWRAWSEPWRRAA